VLSYLHNVLVPLIRLRSKIHQIEIDSVHYTLADNRSDRLRLSIISIRVTDSTAADNPCSIVLSTTPEKLTTSLVSTVDS
jgi:hypothetical protein